MTSMRRSGYTHYLYCGPGIIHYYRSLHEAQEAQRDLGGSIGDVI